MDGNNSSNKSAGSHNRGELTFNYMRLTYQCQFAQLLKGYFFFFQTRQWLGGVKHKKGHLLLAQRMKIFG